MNPSHSSNKAVVGVIVIALLAIAATAVIVLSANNNTTDTTASDMPASSSPESSISTEPSNSSLSFKGGTFNATGNYKTPGGMESIAVSVTLGSDGIVTDATVTPEGKTGEAQNYQNKFASGFKLLVVGKKIDEVQLSRVAGSSLTSGGFNDAIKDIEKQASA